MVIKGEAILEMKEGEDVHLTVGRPINYRKERALAYETQLPGLNKQSKLYFVVRHESHFRYIDPIVPLTGVITIDTGEAQL